MKVEKVMKRDVITIQQDTTIQEAKDIMTRNKIRHIPVVNHHNQLIGIVSDRDLVLDRLPENEDAESAQVHAVMTKQVITAHPLDFIEELLTVFYEERIGCIPVVNQREVVGIITERDMLYTLIQLTGAHQPSSQFEVHVENISGKLADVTAVIRHHNVNITSVLVYPGDNDATKVLVLRLQTMNPQPIIDHLKSEGYNVMWPVSPGEQV